jgi:7-cyano-7-deazaguanine synthase in queuosine biosynthesis
MSDKVLVMYSGGIDSACALYKCLAEGHEVHAHHVNLVNLENMALIQGVVCRRFIKELRRMKFSVEYSESTMVIPTGCWDLYPVWFIAGLTAQKYTDIRYVTTGRNGSDTGPMSRPGPRAMFKRLFDTVYRHGLKRAELPCDNLPVISNMNKKEVWDYLPENLQALTWSCRNPIYNDGFAYNCNRGCGACTSLQSWGIPHERKFSIQKI